MKTHIIFYFLFLTTCSYGQSLEQYVIGSAGNFNSTSSGTSLSWTIGEPLISTESSSTAILTQGFHQPLVVTPLSTNLNLNQAIDLQAFPNPTLEKVTLKKETNTVLKAELLDILGQSIGHYSLVEEQTTLSLETLPAATYLLCIRALNGQIIKTFKIQKTQ
jgi:hypothetical protein